MNRSTIASHAVEARLAARLAGSLTPTAEALPHDITERLRAARERALTHARARRHQVQAAPAALGVGRSAGGAGLLGLIAPWWRRGAALLPLVVLLGGLAAIDTLVGRDHVLTAAEIDAQLLADNLPPQAYADPGFGEFLRTAPR